MIVELDTRDYQRASGLFHGMDFHLAVPAVLGKSVSGKVFVDKAANPRSGLLWANGRLHLAGDTENVGFNRAVGRLFTEKIFPQSKAAGRAAISLCYDKQGWETAIQDSILRGKHADQYLREYYTFWQLEHDWRAMLPEGFELRLIDEQLLANRPLENLGRLKAELCSERESVADFLQKSFGACLLYQDSLAAWCLSEYNYEDRCEIGIETVEAYQRRGLATLTASAFIEYALERGIGRIGWHSFDWNTASVATARKIGFLKDRCYPAYIIWLA